MGKMLSDVYTDHAKAMMGHSVGDISILRGKEKNSRSNYCVLHRHTLALRQMSSDLVVVLNDALKIIKYIN